MKKARLTASFVGFVLSILVLCTPRMVAQGLFGTISGTVTDSSGAVVPGATVTVVNVNTNVTKALAATAFAGFMLATMSSEASAWYCRAGGDNSSGWARSASYDRAKHLSLYQCYRRSDFCRISYCVR